MLGAVETEAAVIRLLGAGVLGGDFWLFDAGGAGLKAAANVAATVAAAPRWGRFFACSSCRNAVASSSDMIVPWMVMLIGSTGMRIIVLLEGFDMAAVEWDEFAGR